MAILIFILTGLLIGWFASIVTRTEDAGGIFKSIGIGALASAIGGLIMNGFMLFGTLDWLALGVAAASAAMVLAAYKLVFVVRF